MNTQNIVVLVIIAAIVVITVAARFYLQRKNTRKLMDKFGPEYDRAVQQVGSAGAAEAVLGSREKRVAKFAIRPLTQEECARLGAEWRLVQERFVDDPAKAVFEADQLINKALAACGYPMSDFEQRTADLSVEHASAVAHYREGHDIATRPLPSTEDLRIAMQHYRALFEDLVDVRSAQPTQVLR
jgi:hypothetical protein